MKKRILSLLAVLVLTVFAVTAVSAYDAVRTYSGQFTDVPAGSWYADYVGGAYSYGIIDGVTSSTFEPDSCLTTEQALKIASVCHQILLTGSRTDSEFVQTDSTWYSGYYNYAKKWNIIVDGDETPFGQNITRAQIAVYFSRVLLSAGGNTTELNSVSSGSILDVSESDWFAGSIYRLYRWGVMTGDGKGYMNPYSTIKRSEIAAVILRVLDPSSRTAVAGKTEATSGGTASATPSGAVTLYKGSTDRNMFTGIQGFAGDFSFGSDGTVTLNASSSLNLINDLTLEENCLSFRLYEGVGYEALGIVRGYLTNAASGIDGSRIRSASDVYNALNQVMFIWINGTPLPVSELWYADHGSYTAYAFYFTDLVDIRSVWSVRFTCGRITGENLRAVGMTTLAGLMEEAYLNSTGAFDNAINAAKSNAYAVISEYTTDRARIIYGQGLYGFSSSDYMLVLIYNDGSVQTISTQKLSSIDFRSGVLYYGYNGADGKEITFAVNLRA